MTLAYIGVGFVSVKSSGLMSWYLTADPPEMLGPARAGPAGEGKQELQLLQGAMGAEGGIRQRHGAWLS